MAEQTPVERASEALLNAEHSVECEMWGSDIPEHSFMKCDPESCGLDAAREAFEEVAAKLEWLHENNVLQREKNNLLRTKLDQAKQRGDDFRDEVASVQHERAATHRLNEAYKKRVQELEVQARLNEPLQVLDLRIRSTMEELQALFKLQSDIVTARSGGEEG